MTFWPFYEILIWVFFSFYVILVTEHILQVFMCATTVAIRVHDPGPRNFNVVGTAVFASLWGGVWTE